jgi:N-acetylneuraminic acid mutarotase
MITRRRAMLATACAVLAPPLRAQARWLSAAPLPGPLQEIYPVVHGGRLVVAGGFGSLPGGGSAATACHAFDPAAGSWLPLPPLPAPRHHATLASSGEHLLQIGGFEPAAGAAWAMQSSVHVLADGAWQPRAPLPEPQAEGVAATAADGLVHLVTGQSPRGSANRVRRDHVETAAHRVYDPGGDRWSERAPIPTPRNSASGGWVDGVLVVAGGRTAAGNLDVTEIYDPRTDAWRRGAPMPLRQAGTAGATLAGRLYVFGGEVFTPAPAVFAECWAYAPGLDRWEAVPPLPTPRHGLGAGAIGERIHVVGGASRPGGGSAVATHEVLWVDGAG